VLAYVVLAVAALAFALPFFWLVTTAFKPDQDIFAFPPHWIPNPPIFDHFVKGLNAYPFGRFFLNSLTVSALGALGAVLSSSLAAYGLSRIDWPGRNILFAAILGTILLPFQVRLIPLFLTYNALHWIDTLLPLFVPYFFGNAFAIFLLRQFFRSIPRDLADAARIDGANEWQIYWQLFMPLAKPAIATVALLTFVERWDDYLGPLIFITSRENATVSLGLSLFRDQYGNSWGQLMAVTTVALVPIIILFFFAQRTFIQGITLTGLK
jgi:multiple sugar transport system permease protein